MEYLMQPIGRSALLEEVGDSLVPAPVPANVGMVVEQEVAEQQRPLGSADAHIMVAKEAAADRRESSPLTSELSMGKMNPGVRMEQEDEDSCCSTEHNPLPKSHQ